ncbi:MAG TPA: GT-D fold domain-containing glycosyltransferase [Bacillota bacterium]|nr:GT-D fold domain-containing glycosyltransferase [Bacillota bacterium]
MKISEQTIHGLPDVYQRIEDAVHHEESLSLIRLCSGEAFTLAHNTVLPMSKIPWWVEYAGVKLPNERARQELLTVVKEADIVGFSTNYANWMAAPLLDSALSYYNITAPAFITDSEINWSLHRYEAFYNLLSSLPIVVVGRLAADATPLLVEKGLEVVAAVSLEGFEDIERAEHQLLNGPSFRVALIAAGIPATIFAQRLSKKLGCIALDYGHVINDLLQPGFNAVELLKVKERWRTINRKKMI